MDEEVLVAVITRRRSPAGFRPLESLDYFCRLVGLDKAHVKRLAAPSDEAAHGGCGVYHLRQLDTIQPFGWIEQKQ